MEVSDSNSEDTDKNKIKFSLIYKEIQKGSANVICD